MDLAGSERVAKTGATAEQLKVIHLILLPIMSLSASIKLYDNQWLFFVINNYCAVIQLALVNSLVNSLDNYQPLSVYLSVLYHIKGEKKNFFEVKKKIWFQICPTGYQKNCKIYRTYFDLKSDRKLCPSTSLCRPWGTSSQPWVVTSSSSPTVTTSWPCSCRTHLEGMLRPSCLSTSRRQTTTKTRPSSRSCKSDPDKG